MGDDAKFVIEDAEKVLDVVFLINEIGLKKYEKDWRKIHKQLGIPASNKVKLTNVEYHYRDSIQPKDKRMKPIYRIRFAIASYKDYRYYVNYNISRIDETKTYSVMSYFNCNDREKLEREVQ